MGTGGSLVVIDFTKLGNATHFVSDGWSVQEPDRIWGLGPRSVLRIPSQNARRGMILEAEIGPLRAPPAITGQLVRVRFNGTLLGSARLNERSMIRCEIDPALTRGDGDQEIQFEFPGFCQLDWFQSIPDDRPLSGWFSFIRLYTTDMFKPGPWFPASHPDFPVLSLSPPLPESTSTAAAPVVHTFGHGGTAEKYLGDDWIAGDSGFSWTVATAARLTLPAPAAAGAYALRIDAKSVVEAGGEPRKVTIVLDGIAIGQLEFDEFGSWVLPLPAELLAGKSSLEFNLIVGGLSSAAVRGGETRLVGVGVSRIAMIPLPSRAMQLERGGVGSRVPKAPRPGVSNATANVTRSDRFGEATPDTLAAAVEAALGVDVAALARGFESLGADREFANAQRALGIDMLHLFRGCEGSLSAVVQAMTDDFAALSDPASIKVKSIDGGEAMQSISVAKYKLRWRLPAEARGKAMTARDAAVMFGYLRRKFFEAVRAGNKIHVLTMERGICVARAAALLLELRRHGPATLLCVEPATEGRRAGSVERFGPGLLRGGVDRATGGGDGMAWLPVLGNAALLHRQAGEMTGAR